MSEMCKEEVICSPEASADGHVMLEKASQNLAAGIVVAVRAGDWRTRADRRMLHPILRQALLAASVAHQLAVFAGLGNERCERIVGL